MKCSWISLVPIPLPRRFPTHTLSESETLSSLLLQGRYSTHALTHTDNTAQKVQLWLHMTGPGAQVQYTSSWLRTTLLSMKPSMKPFSSNSHSGLPSAVATRLPLGKDAHTTIHVLNTWPSSSPARNLAHSLRCLPPGAPRPACWATAIPALLSAVTHPKVTAWRSSRRRLRARRHLLAPATTSSRPAHGSEMSQTWSTRFGAPSPLYGGLILGATTILEGKHVR